jgi:hypothetical protein
LSTFGEEDKKKIVREVKRRALDVGAELLAERNLAENQAAEAVDINNAPGGDNAVLPVYDPLFNHLDAEGIVLPAPAPPAAEVLMTTVDTELAAYEKATKLMRVKETVTDAQGNQRQVLNNPLEWWKLRRRELPTLAALARRTLCVPATSAPSERLFSTAGLTIANDRASLLPDNAADLIFLHDAWPLMEEHIASKRRRLNNDDI